MNRFTDIISIDKVLYLGSYPEAFPAHNPKGEIIRQMPIFCKVEYKDGKLSISGVIAPKANGNCWGSCGQIYDEITENLNRIEWAKGWDKAKAFQFVEYWKEWHLNNLQAGCEHQRAAKWEDERINPKDLPNSHANQDEKGILAIWVYPPEAKNDPFVNETHPKGLLTKPCPVCGYKYGSEWKTKEVPQKVLKFLQDLPENELKPAWI